MFVSFIKHENQLTYKACQPLSNFTNINNLVRQEERRRQLELKLTVEEHQRLRREEEEEKGRSRREEEQRELEERRKEAARGIKGFNERVHDT